MAISCIGSANSDGSGTFTFSTGLFNSAGGHPTLQQDDVIIVTYSVAYSSSYTVTTPTGYTALHTPAVGTDSAVTTLHSFYKRMGATPDTTFAPPSIPSGADDEFTIFAFRGVIKSGSILDGSVATANGANSGQANAPSITPTTSGAWIIASGGGSNTTTTSSVYTRPANLSSTTSHFRSIGGSTTYGGVVGTGLKTDWTSGSFDPDAFGGTNTGTTYSWAAVTYAIKPEPVRQYGRTVSITY